MPFIFLPCIPDIWVLPEKFNANETLIFCGYHDLLTHKNVDFSKLDSFKLSCLSSLLGNMKVFSLVDERAETQFAACLFSFSVSLSLPPPHPHNSAHSNTLTCSHREMAQSQLIEILEEGLCSFRFRLMSYLTRT